MRKPKSCTETSSRISRQARIWLAGVKVSSLHFHICNPALIFCRAAFDEELRARRLCRSSLSAHVLTWLVTAKERRYEARGAYLHNHVFELPQSSIQTRVHLESSENAHESCFELLAVAAQKFSITKCAGNWSPVVDFRKSLARNEHLSYPEDGADYSGLLV
jgi:hypothetical protein